MFIDKEDFAQHNVLSNDEIHKIVSSVYPEIVSF